MVLRADAKIAGLKASADNLEDPDTDWVPKLRRHGLRRDQRLESARRDDLRE
jgi:hypothetical protein